jgi:hypothetical protein
MISTTLDIGSELRSKLIELGCWYVNAGGSRVGSSFSLAFGEKVARAVPLTNTAHSQLYREYEGSANLLVWCTWRLDGRDESITSSDDTEEGITNGLAHLSDCKIVDIIVERPCWDLKILFSPFYRLQLFCDHVPGDPSFDGNWEMHLPGEALYFGPGNKFEVANR